MDNKNDNFSIERNAAMLLRLILRGGLLVCTAAMAAAAIILRNAGSVLDPADGRIVSHLIENAAVIGIMTAGTVLGIGRFLRQRKRSAQDGLHK